MERPIAPPSAALATSAAADAGAVEASPPRRTPFRLAATRPRQSEKSLELWALDDGTLFVSGGFALGRAGKQSALVRDPEMSRGLPESWADGGYYEGEVDGIVGGSLDTAYLALARYEEKFHRVGEVYRWDKTRWKQARPSLGREFVYAALARWIDSRPLALVVRSAWVDRKVDQPIDGPSAKTKLSPPEFRVVDGGKKLALPKLERDFCPSTFSARVSGEIVAVGTRCDGSGAMVERWAAGNVHGVVESLPQPDCSEIALPEDLAIAFRSPSDVWISGVCRAALAHFDGTAWQRVELPKATPTGTVSLGADGSPWIGASSSDSAAVAHRRRDGAWTLIPLPAASAPDAKPVVEYEVQSVYARSDDDVYAVARSDKEAVLLTTATPQDVVHYPDGDELGSELADLAARPSAGPCGGGAGGMEALRVVVLAPPGSPLEYDFPEVRAALDGHLELAEVMFTKRIALGRLRLEARAERIGLARQLVQVLAADKNVAPPSMVCGGSSAYGEPVEIEF
jgi:hypothetical protein